MYYSESEKAEFIIIQINNLIQYYGFIKRPDISLPEKININKLFFSLRSDYPEIIYTNNFNNENKNLQKTNSQMLFKFFLRYDDNLVFEKINNITIDKNYPRTQSEFPPYKKCRWLFFKYYNNCRCS